MTHIKNILKKNTWKTAPSPILRKEILCNTNCDVCGGVGFVRYDVPMDDPRFGKMWPCPKLPPDSTIFDGHGLTSREIATLDWNVLTERENIRDGIQAMEGLLKRGRGMVYLHGGAGLAKTRMLQILCAKWARSGRGLFHLTTQKELIDFIRVAYDDDEPQRAVRDREDMFIRRFSLLAIDEVTTERSTDFKVDEFFHIINKRHEAGVEYGGNFATVMTGNISPKQLDYRILDRLSDGRNQIVKLDGDSYRPAMEWTDEPEPIRDDAPRFRDPNTREILQ